MGTVILNVSLDEKVGPGSIGQRYRTVMACMRLCFRNVVGEVGLSRYDGPDGPVQEHCAVVQIELEAGSLHAFQDAIHHIAQSLGQDCIAVLYSDGAEGKCIGPHAERWPFSRAFFVMPAVCRLQAAA